MTSHAVYYFYAAGLVLIDVPLSKDVHYYFVATLFVEQTL